MTPLEIGLTIWALVAMGAATAFFWRMRQWKREAAILSACNDHHVECRQSIEENNNELRARLAALKSPASELSVPRKPGRKGLAIFHDGKTWKCDYREPPSGGYNPCSWSEPESNCRPVHRWATHKKLLMNRIGE